MLHTTTNFYANWTKSDMYHPTTFSPIISELLAPFGYFSALKQRRIQRLSNIKSCEIENKHKLSSSPTEFMRDLYLQSNLSWQDYVTTTKLHKMRDQYDPDTFEKISQYNNLCNIMTFEALHAYFDTNPTKFTNDMNFILDTESSIYNHLCKMNINANTCMILESRHTEMLQKSHKTNNPQPHGTCTNIAPDEELEDDNDPDPEYKVNTHQGLSEYSQRQTLNHTYTLWRDQMMHKEDKLHALFSGYMNEYEYEIPIDIVNACIMFTYGSCYTVDRFLRENIIKLEPEPFSFGHYNINWNNNDAELVQVHNSRVSNHVIENRLNLYPILNSVHSEHNVANTMTWLYIKYEDIVIIYMYITDDNGKSYGTRLTADNIATVVPSLFVKSQIKVSLDGFKSAIDPILDEYRIVLFENHRHIKSQSYLLNSYQQRIQDIINDCNAIKTEYDVLLTLNGILTIFEYGKIDEDYFMERNNYKQFVTLLRDNNIKLDVINEFWYRLNGATMTNIDIDGIAEEESNTDDVDLDELNEDIISNWHGEEQLMSNFV